MTYSDLESRSRSTINIQKLQILVGNLHAHLEDPSFIITRVIMFNAKLGQCPLMTLKVGHRQSYTYLNSPFGRELSCKIGRSEQCNDLSQGPVWRDGALVGDGFPQLDVGSRDSIFEHVVKPPLHGLPP
jgi:hypothetical protein